MAICGRLAAERRSEIGIRLALGATPGSILGLVLGEGLRLVAAGTAIGLLAALVATRFVGSLLFGLEPFDPATFAAGSALLAAVAMLACYMPARRAMRIDPALALKR